MAKDTTIFIDPRSQGRGIRSLHNTDVIYEPHTGDQILDTESLVVVGNWTDYTGSGTQTKSAVVMQGVVNDLQGTDAAVEDNERFSTLNVFGKRVATNRLRQRLTTLEFAPLNPSK